MKYTTKLLLASVISSIAFLSINNSAYAEAENAQSTQNISEVAYLNGGIGQEESSEIRSKAGSFNLRLYLSEGKPGQSITNAQITVTDKNDNVKLNIADGGPMLFLHLENGRYKISAQHNGITILRNVVIANHRGTNVYLNWKNLEADTEVNVDEVQSQAI